MSEERSPSLPWISWEVKPVALGRDQEAGQAAVLQRRVGLGEDQRDLGEVAERDPHLLAADRPARVGLRRPGAEVGGVGAGVGLGQPEAAERLARAEPRQPALLLLLGAPALDRAGDERGLDRDHGAGRGVGAADLLDDQPVAEVVEAASPVFLGDRGAEVADLAELARQLAVEAGGPVVVADPGGDLAVGEFARRLGDQSLLVAQLEVHLTHLCSFGRLCQIGQSSLPRVSWKACSASRVRGPGRLGKLDAVDRGHRLDLARRRGEEGLGRGAQVGDRPGALLDVEGLDQTVAGDRFEDAVVERRRPQGALRRDPEDRRGRRLEDGAVGQDAGPPRPRPGPGRCRVACMFAA